MNVKQTLVFRRDLKVRKGKLIAQGAHGAMAFILAKLHWLVYSVEGNKSIFDKVKFSSEEHEWIKKMHTKVCLVVDDEAALIDIYNKANEAGLTTHLIEDAGLTEFHGIPTLTCVAIGPHESERIDAVTKGLDLF